MEVGRRHLEALLVGADLPDLASLLNQPEWMHEAACRGKTRLFFANDLPSIQSARRICAGCPVAEACSEAADRRDERFGIWGGMKRSRRVRTLRYEARVPGHRNPEAG